MRQKEASGDPDMLRLKDFLMTEVVWNITNNKRHCFSDQTHRLVLERKSGLPRCKVSNIFSLLT